MQNDLLTQEMPPNERASSRDPDAVAAAGSRS